jgi:hypothetical protein
VPTHDDTRDIALEARSSSAAAHHRLDKMNGSIDRLGNEAAKLREDTTAGFAKLAEDSADATLMLVAGLTEVKTTVRNALRVVAVIVALVMTVIGGVSVWMFTTYLPSHHQLQQQPPAQASTQQPK